MVEVKAYTQAATTGKYDKESGLLGKYDNVRRFWEDQLTGLFLRPALNDLLAQRAKEGHPLHILDLGCGNGDGYDLITGVSTEDPGINEHMTAAVTMDRLKFYLGIDINPELLSQAETCYGTNPKMCFQREDLSNGLPESILAHDPFDLYFSSYGTWSHFHDDQAATLVADIARHAADGALFVGDWLGRWSYEWQDLWDAPMDAEYFMDYRISYIYPPEERDKVEVAGFPLRLMCQDEIQQIINAAERLADCRIIPLKYFDRSILVGRHLETGDYNANCPRLRHSINSLFEGETRTDLEKLMVDYIPRQGFEDLNNFFDSFFMASNTLVQYTIDLLSGYDAKKDLLTTVPQIQSHHSRPLVEALHSMRRIIAAVAGLSWSDVRANVIESHLGYCLRKLEMELQPGTGVGHSLCGIFQIRKP